MTREELTTFLQQLPASTDKHMSVDADIVEVRQKAILVETMTGIHTKRAWLPVSQLASVDRGKVFGLGLAVKRSWIGRQKLWFLT
jgi:hypothetical protein